MKVKNKKMIVAGVAVCTVLLACSFPAFLIYENVTYKKYAGKEIYSNKNHELILTYHNKDIDLSSYDTSALVTQLQYRHRQLYFGDIHSDKNERIRLTSPEITITLFPKDDKSVALEFDMQRGIDRTYTLTDVNFNQLLDVCYKITGDDIFVVSGK